MKKAYVLNAGEGRTTLWHDVAFTMKAAREETGGRFALWEITTKPGEEPHLHVHDDVDEIFYVLKGDITFQAGDGRSAKRFRVADGAFVYIPLGTPHAYEIHSRSVKMLGISASSDFGDHVERTGKRVRAVKVKKS
jgi:quercetin dioxygenase-like cupin family protein